MADVDLDWNGVVRKAALRYLGGGSSSSPSPITSSPFDVASQFTRPNDTTAYSINDVVGGVLEFASVAASGKTVMIDNVNLRIDLSAIPSGMTSFTLHFYNATPPSAYADNAAWDLPAGDRSIYLGSIVVGTPVDLGSTLYIKQTGQTFQCRPSGTSLFAYLVTATAYTPAAQTVYTPAIHGFAV